MRYSLKLQKMGRILLKFSSNSFRSPWLWSSCKLPKTHSFRAAAAVELSSASVVSVESSFSYPSLAAESENFSVEETTEAIISGLRSDKLFFEPGTRSLVEEVMPLTGGVAVEMESEDPYRDFRMSMEEMVVACDVKDLAGLEEMLFCYLRLNGEKVHEFIVRAFVDLMVYPADSSCPFACSYSTSSSSCTFDEVDR